MSVISSQKIINQSRFQHTRSRYIVKRKTGIIEAVDFKIFNLFNIAFHIFYTIQRSTKLKIPRINKKNAESESTLKTSQLKDDTIEDGQCKWDFGSKLSLNPRILIQQIDKDAIALRRFIRNIGTFSFKSIPRMAVIIKNIQRDQNHLSHHPSSLQVI